MKTILRIGTRRSMLAMAQSQQAAGALKAAVPGVDVELVGIVTGGDVQKGALTEIGGKGLFTAELEAALRGGRIDLAVHSAKDLPAIMPDDLMIAAAPPREDARDALVSPGGRGVDSLPPGAVVGTSSLRRAAQILAMRKDVKIVPIRGNVETRMGKVLEGQGGVSATVLAMAGLNRGGLARLHGADIRPLEIESFIPAAGQGLLAVQCLAGRVGERIAAIARAIDDPISHEALLAERSVVAALGASCRSCLAVHLVRRGRQWQALAMAARPDGSGMVRASAAADACNDAAAQLLEQLVRSGARELLA